LIWQKLNKNTFKLVDNLSFEDFVNNFP